MSETNPTADRNRLFRVLQHRYRRGTLFTLRKQESSMNVETLAERVADTTDDVRSVTISLHHVHLPMLEEHGLVSYDPTEKTVGLPRGSSPSGERTRHTSGDGS